MRAAWYEKQGAARDVLTVGEMDDPRPDAIAQAHEFVEHPSRPGRVIVAV